MSIRKEYDAATKKIISVGQCPVGLTFFHNSFLNVATMSYCTVMELVKKDTQAYCHWYDIRWPDDIKSDIVLPLDYQVTVAMPKEVKGKMPLICEACKKKTKVVWLDVNDGKCKCEECLSAGKTKRSSRCGVGERTAGKLIKVKGIKGAPPRMVPREQLNVSFEAYLKLNVKEQNAALKCMTDPAAVNKALEYEKEHGHKGRVKKAIKRLKRLHGRK